MLLGLKNAAASRLTLERQSTQVPNTSKTQARIVMRALSARRAIKKGGDRPPFETGCVTYFASAFLSDFFADFFAPFLAFVGAFDSAFTSAFAPALLSTLASAFAGALVVALASAFASAFGACASAAPVDSANAAATRVLMSLFIRTSSCLDARITSARKRGLTPARKKIRLAG